VVTAYEARIDNLEKEKLVIAERLHAEPAKHRPFDEVFELTLKFLSNPYNIWKTCRAKDRKTVLRPVFSEPLKFARNEGFRTPKTSSVFNALKRFESPGKGVAERQGFEPWVPLRAH
jgi:site-specific DNA recombinase